MVFGAGEAGRGRLRQIDKGKLHDNYMACFSERELKEGRDHSS